MRCAVCKTPVRGIKAMSFCPQCLELQDTEAGEESEDSTPEHAETRRDEQ